MFNFKFEMNSSQNNINSHIRILIHKKEDVCEINFMNVNRSKNRIDDLLNE